MTVFPPVATTHKGVRDTLPKGSRLTSTFGYPGEGGYAEFWLAPDGAIYRISNGSYLETMSFR